MHICIVGTGYVGLVSAACFAEMGNHVMCVDINPEVVRQLENGRIHIYEPGLDVLVSRNSRDGRLFFTTDIQAGLEEAEVVFITVGTPPRDDGSCVDCGECRHYRQLPGALLGTCGHPSQSAPPAPAAPRRRLPRRARQPGNAAAARSTTTTKEETP